MLKYQWQMLTIQNSDDFQMLKNIVEEVQPNVGAVDTETDGLHIINCKPFVVQFGFLSLRDMKGFTFAVDLERCPIADEVLSYWESIAHRLVIYVGHNIKFDLHMLANIGHEYKENNLTDTTFWIRFGHDALHPEEGGPLLGLKEYASKYIDRNAKLHEKLLDKEKTELVKEYNNRLKVMLKQSGKSFTLKDMNEVFNDCIFEIDDLPEDIKEIYIEWKRSLPLYLQHKVTTLVTKDMIRYNDLNRENLIRYAHYDIVYTLEIWSSLYNIVHNRGQAKGLHIENGCILPWYEMERTGFKANKVYLEESRKRLKKYIKENRSLLYQLAGEEVKVGQHAAIKRILHDRFKIDAKSTGDEYLSRLKADIDNPDAIEFINTLQELRTLEKWYSVYILRFQKELQLNDKLYTTINQVGTVSGRVTSDYQQFPKKGITDRDGNELFHPRKIIYTDSAMVYLDYSQIELRFQAMYTILVGNPDMNMCRAYMPYNCYAYDRYDNKIYFDYNDPFLVRNYNIYKWRHIEDDERWEPVDVHGATTLAAFPGLKKTDPEYHDLRYIGKKVNFAKNYGAELNRIKQMFPEKTHEECVMINDAYYKAFPGVKQYHQYCAERAAYYSNTENLFGIKYYNVNGHKLKNMLIQGSAAYYLKWKIMQLYEYCKEHNIKSKFQMQIHDELSWEYDPADPPEIFFEFKKIMEKWNDSKVPIIADMEATNSTWADKKEVNTLEELKGIIL